jgi:hypothetical protein
MRSNGIYSQNHTIASWTYDPTASGYGSIGVEGGIQKAKQQMDRLYELLSGHRIPLSVGVYPWPQQLLYDSENSQQVKIWRWKMQKIFQSFSRVLSVQGQGSRFRTKSIRLGGYALQPSRSSNPSR